MGLLQPLAPCPNAVHACCRPEARHRAAHRPSRRSGEHVQWRIGAQQVTTHLLGHDLGGLDLFRHPAPRGVRLCLQSFGQLRVFGVGLGELVLKGRNRAVGLLVYGLLAQVVRPVVLGVDGVDAPGVVGHKLRHLRAVGLVDGLRLLVGRCLVDPPGVVCLLYARYGRVVFRQQAGALLLDRAVLLIGLSLGQRTISVTLSRPAVLSGLIYTVRADSLRAVAERFLEGIGPLLADRFEDRLHFLVEQLFDGPLLHGTLDAGAQLVVNLAGRVAVLLAHLFHPPVQLHMVNVALVAVFREPLDAVARHRVLHDAVSRLVEHVGHLCNALVRVLDGTPYAEQFLMYGWLVDEASGAVTVVLVELRHFIPQRRPLVALPSVVPEDASRSVFLLGPLRLRLFGQGGARLVATLSVFLCRGVAVEPAELPGGQGVVDGLTVAKLGELPVLHHDGRVGDVHPADLGGGHLVRAV